MSLQSPEAQPEATNLLLEDSARQQWLRGVQSSAPQATPNIPEADLLLNDSMRQDWLDGRQVKDESEARKQELAEIMAPQYYKAGMTEYGKFMYGEEWAKRMFLLALMMGAGRGMSVVVYGDPEGGKSLLLENGPKVVDGIDDDNIALVPHNIDSPARLLGEDNPIVKYTKDQYSNVSEETLNAIIQSIITPETRAAIFDEPNRMVPVVLQAALRMLQNGYAEVYDKSGKLVKTNIFDIIAFGENHYGTEFTYPTDPALISRRGLGAFMGIRGKSKADQVSGLYISGSGHTEGAKHALQNPNEPYIPEIAVSPVVDSRGLEIMRDAIHRVRYGKDSGKNELYLTDKLSAGMLDALHEEGLRISDNRVVRHIMRAAQGMALMNGREVTDIDVRNAVNYSMTAKMGAFGNKSDDEIKTKVEKVLRAA